MIDFILVALPRCLLPLSSLENTALDSFLIYMKTKCEGNRSAYNTNIPTAGSLSPCSLVVISLDFMDPVEARVHFPPTPDRDALVP